MASLTSPNNALTRTTHDCSSCGDCVLCYLRKECECGNSGKCIFCLAPTTCRCGDTGDCAFCLLQVDTKIPQEADDSLMTIDNPNRRYIERVCPLIEMSKTIDPPYSSAAELFARGMKFAGWKYGHERATLTSSNIFWDYAEPDASVGNSTAERHEEYEDLPPKLEEYLAEDCLPNFLNVIDQGQCTSGNQGKLEPGVRFADSTPVVHTYIRQYPAPGINCDAVACLVLSPTNLHGAGRHSSIYRAKFTLPCSLTTNARSDGTVTVIAKTAFDAEQDRKELKEEARLYREMSKTPNRHLQMGWDGYVTIPGFEAEFPAEAIVPKFYGYYKPPEGSDGLSPILLMEDCGKPAASIDQLGQYDRERIISMYVRLHDAGFHQSSQYRRNVMIQPGPLTIKPSERSLAEPSFRLIDFGKGGRLQKKSHRSYFKDLDDWTGYQLYRRNELLDNLQDRFEVIIRKPGDTVVQEWNPQVGPMTNRSMRQIY